MTDDRPSIAELQRIEREMEPGKYRVHFCSDQPDDEACGICTGCDDEGRCGEYADILGSDARDECTHPVSLPNATGMAALRNAAPVLLEIAAAALAWQTSPQAKARQARAQLLAALGKVAP
jgi:hypothetical protein